MHQNDVKLNIIKENLNGELSEIIHYECSFCLKTTKLHTSQRKLCEKLSGESFFCNHCIRNGFNNKNNRNVLILSFRSIIGFYHQILYLGNKKLYFSQINDFVESHIETGLINPAFEYDHDSFLWFVDFSKVGRGRKKISVKEILKTTANILTCFNLNLLIDNFDSSKLYSKYEEAIVKFYQQRYRPENRKLLIPTLNECGGICNQKQIDHEHFRNFLTSNFFPKK